MAPRATILKQTIQLSDVDQNVYETLELQLARHPSESPRYLVTRTLAYCLSYAPGIAFSRGGLSSPEEPPVAIHDSTGRLLAWVDVGVPSADRLHKAAKAAGKVAVYTTSLNLLQREAKTRTIYKADQIEVFDLPKSVVEPLERLLEQAGSFEITRNEGQLYITHGRENLEGPVLKTGLSETS